METCLLCKKRFDSETVTPEHILLNALGGKALSRDTICSDCNFKLGGTLDYHLCNGMNWLRNLLELKKGDGSPPPNVSHIGKDGITRFLEPGLKAKSRLAETVSRYSITDDRTIRIEIRGHKKAIPSLTKKLIKKISEEQDIPIEKLRAQMSMSTPTDINETEEVHSDFELDLGGIKGVRSLAKSCLTLAATNKPQVKSLLLSPNGSNFTVFVNTGKESETIFWYDHNVPDFEKFMVPFYGPLFNLIVVFDHPTQGLIGYFRLFNSITVRFRLSYKTVRGDFYRILVSNPLNREFAIVEEGWEPIIDSLRATPPLTKGDRKVVQRNFDVRLQEALATKRRSFKVSHKFRD